MPERRNTIFSSYDKRLSSIFQLNVECGITNFNNNNLPIETIINIQCVGFILSIGVDRNMNYITVKYITNISTSCTLAEMMYGLAHINSLIVKYKSPIIDVITPLWDINRNDIY